MTEQKSDDLRMGALYIRVSTHEQDELSRVMGSWSRRARSLWRVSPGVT